MTRRTEGIISLKTLSLEGRQNQLHKIDLFTKNSTQVKT